MIEEGTLRQIEEAEDDVTRMVWGGTEMEEMEQKMERLRLLRVKARESGIGPLDIVSYHLGDHPFWKADGIMLAKSGDKTHVLSREGDCVVFRTLDARMVEEPHHILSPREAAMRIRKGE